MTNHENIAIIAVLPYIILVFILVFSGYRHFPKTDLCQLEMINCLNDFKIYKSYNKERNVGEPFGTLLHNCNILHNHEYGN